MTAEASSSPTDPIGQGEAMVPGMADVRQVGEQLLRVIEIAPEDPEAVRIRDGVAPEKIGSRPMATALGANTTPAFGLGESQRNPGRKAPKHLDSDKGYR
jgi:hypothetical protein